jgi:MOSC domain-containing protein YiiM
VTVRHLTRAELEAGLEAICDSPKDDGVLELIVSRPSPGAREVLDQAQLDPAAGMITDSWAMRVAQPDPATQLTVMNARVIALIAQDRARWPLAGDQLYVDLDLADENIPPGTQLAIGSAVIEVSAEPHTGCGKFVQRFGVDAMKFVNSALGRQLHLRGINARVIRTGDIRVGDRARKVV